MAIHKTEFIGRIKTIKQCFYKIHIFTNVIIKLVFTMHSVHNAIHVIVNFINRAKELCLLDASFRNATYGPREKQ